MSRGPLAPVVGAFRGPGMGWSARRLIKGALFLAAATLAAVFIDFRRLAEGLRGASAGWLIALLVLATADRVLMAYKWKHLAAAGGVNLPFWPGIKAYYAATFLNYFIPTGFGGDILRGHYLSLTTGRRDSVFASLAMEKVLGFFSAVAAAWIGLAYLVTIWDSPGKTAFAYALLAASVGAGAALIMSMDRSVHRWINVRLGRWKTTRPVRFATKVYAAYMEFGSAKGRLAGNFALSLIENGVKIALAYGAGLALGLDIPPASFAAIVSVTVFVRRLSIYLDSWGVSEAISVVMFGLVGIEPSQALAISLLRHGVVTVSAAPGGLVLMRGGKGFPQK